MLIRHKSLQIPSLRILFNLALAAGPVLLLATAPPAFAADPKYHVTEKLHLDGGVKWDYLSFDAVHKRLFITRGDHVDVFDTVTKKVIGTIPDTHGVHGVALAPDLNLGFTSNGQDSTVTVFELESLKVVTTIATGERPDAIVYDAGTKRVFTANAKGQSLSAIDALRYRVVGTVPLRGKPEFTVVDGSGLLYVNVEDKNELVVVDTKKLLVASTYDLSSGCEEPAGLAVDAAKRRLFTTCHNNYMLAVDFYLGGRIAPALPIGRGSDAAVYDAGAGLAFSSNGDGTLTVVGAKDLHTYEVRQTVTTMPGARTMALDPATHKLYLVTAEIDDTPPPAGQPAPTRARFKPGTFTLLIVSP